ncbi:hypothetical protein PCANC_17439 [Puccinia coronata f. sp. avenae]|uniref:Uncharacterized protein n=1 Tax=Puccinia coronata f. sp. avenae TaxID=200324 RepID=A0A2N5SEC1_9BASI|nr:hypothetical protein PCANC_21467 [Puccinia coronata f. sp. avenae]PLW41594.1 hypothetical protein PCANC_17439 [Puccinia coronata f. sp. avenae]
MLKDWARRIGWYQPGIRKCAGDGFFDAIVVTQTNLQFDDSRDEDPLRMRHRQFCYFHPRKKKTQQQGNCDCEPIETRSWIGGLQTIRRNVESPPAPT